MESISKLNSVSGNFKLSENYVEYSPRVNYFIFINCYAAVYFALRIKCDLAALLAYFLWVMQTRFSEALNEIQERFPDLDEDVTSYLKGFSCFLVIFVTQVL